MDERSYERGRPIASRANVGKRNTLLRMGRAQLQRLPEGKWDPKTDS